MELNTISSVLPEYKTQKTYKQRYDLNKIINADCVKYLENWPKNTKFDLVIADPPYNIGKNFGSNLSLEKYIEWSKIWIKKCLSLLKKMV